MTLLLDLCYDVLVRILEEINPEDLSSCAQTSKGFNDFIKQNKRLYKAHYLRNFVWPHQWGWKKVHKADCVARTTRGEGLLIRSQNG